MCDILQFLSTVNFHFEKRVSVETLDLVKIATSKEYIPGEARSNFLGDLGITFLCIQNMFALEKMKHFLRTFCNSDT